MIEEEIRVRIAEALAGRRGQQAFVDELSAAWRSTGDALEQLVRALDGVYSSAADQPAEFRQTVGPFLAGSDGDRSRVDELRCRLETAGRQLDAARARVRRETVNIGVIGGTKVGKSTLLRTITELPTTVIPTTRFNPTTATASRIYHTEGQPVATLHLHNWESFRDQYLVPLHESAGLGPAPLDAEAFRQYAYPAPGSAQAGPAMVDDYLRKLRSAQASLASYVELLHGSTRTITVDFADLRPYVAYPDEERGDAVDHQPFHAVQHARIDQNFPAEVATKLGLIDLPGAGEAGLDIDRQFLQRVKGEIDLLLMVKRGDRTNATHRAEDSYTRALADSARAGVPLEDYYMVLVNRDAANDPDGDYFANTVDKLTEVSLERNITVLAADVIDQEDVYAKLMRPALAHLAVRLAEMDRAIVREALVLASAVASEIADYASAALAKSRDLAQLLPDQEDELRNLAEQLRDDLADDLAALVDRYDQDTKSGGADAVLAGAISDAVNRARGRVRDGLGRGDRSQWLSEIRGRYVYGSLKAKQEEYYRAKTEIGRIFGRIDISLDTSVERLWEDIAQVLRDRLTQELVPVGPRALDQLGEVANGRRALILRDALQRLCRLKVEYGSVVLRVTQPIIRDLHWDRAPGARPPASPSLAPKPASPARSAVLARPARGPVGGWVRQPDGSMQRAVSVVSTPPMPTADVPAQPVRKDAANGPAGEQETAKRGAEGLYDELTAAVDQCIVTLERGLRAEAEVMSRTLAAAADQFFDSAIRTNRSERDYENLCKPDQRAIWPNRFADGTARLSADLSRVQEQSRLVLAATETVSRMSGGLRLHSIAGS